MGAKTKYYMTEQELALSIKKRLDDLAQKYEKKGEQLLYEQGILLGLLAVLAYSDSKNLDIVLAKLKSLK